LKKRGTTTGKETCVSKPGLGRGNARKEGKTKLPTLMQKGEGGPAQSLGKRTNREKGQILGGKELPGRVKKKKEI